MKKVSQVVLGIDPGHGGSFVLTDGGRYIRIWKMPLLIAGKEKSVSYVQVFDILHWVWSERGLVQIFLERAMPMAMGSKHAFNYGRDFQTLCLAIQETGMPMTMVEPAKWTKEMHEGTSADLKAKARSLIAVQRLYPHLVGQLPRQPKKGTLMDGPVDALLIAGYGLRRLGVKPERATECLSCGEKTYFRGECSRLGCPGDFR